MERSKREREGKTRGRRKEREGRVREGEGDIDREWVVFKY